MVSIITLTAVSEVMRRKCHGWYAQIHEWQKHSPHEFSQGGQFQYIVLEEWENGSGLEPSQEIWFRIDPKTASWNQIDKPKHFQGVYKFAFAE